MKAAVLVWSSLMLLGCLSSSAREPVPAVIVGANAASRDELNRVVSQALGRDRVVLADDALTSSSELVLEPARPRDDVGRLMQGRDMRIPEHFRLTIDGTRCYLLQASTGRRFRLLAAHCVPRK